MIGYKSGVHDSIFGEKMESVKTKLDEVAFVINGKKSIIEGVRLNFQQGILVMLEGDTRAIDHQSDI